MLPNRFLWFGGATPCLGACGGTHGGVWRCSGVAGGSLAREAKEDFVTLESVWRRVAAHRSRNLNPHLPYEISSASS